MHGFSSQNAALLRVGVAIVPLQILNIRISAPWATGRWGEDCVQENKPREIAEYPVRCTVRDGLKAIRWYTFSFQGVGFNIQANLSLTQAAGGPDTAAKSSEHQP